MKNYSNTTLTIIRHAKRLEISERYQNEIREQWRTQSFEMYEEGHPKEIQAWASAITILLQAYCGAKPKVVILDPNDCYATQCSSSCLDKSPSRKTLDLAVKRGNATDNHREIGVFISMVESYLVVLVSVIIQVELAKKPFGEQDPTRLDLQLPKTYSQLGDWIRNGVPQGIQDGFCETTEMIFSRTVMQASTALGISAKDAETIVMDNFVQIIRVVTLNYSAAEELATNLVADGFLLRKTVDPLVADIYDQLFETIDLDYNPESQNK